MKLEGNIERKDETMSEEEKKRKKRFWFKVGFLLGSGVNGLIPLYISDEYERMKKKEKQRQQSKETSKQAVWICPVCKQFDRNPEEHLKRTHNISNDMLEFWVQKGFID